MPIIPHIIRRYSENNPFVQVGGGVSKGGAAGESGVVVIKYAAA